MLLELSYQEGSIYNSELNLTNPDAECQTDPLEEVESSYLPSQPQVGSMDDPHKHSENIKKGQIEVGGNDRYFPKLKTRLII